MASFKYAPITASADIRLVKLKPGISSEPVHCELVNVSFSDAPSYHALSYTWGKPSDGFKQIYVAEQFFQVGISLYEALKALRHNSTEIRCLWIDSLCINQADEEERSSQVRRMGNIYRQAIAVLVWLGTAGENSNLAIATINRISQLPAADEQDEKKLKRDFIRHRAAWTAVGRLCGRGYWKRMWVIQEVQLAYRLQIHCGTKSTTWEALMATFSLAHYTLKCKFHPGEEKVLLDVTNSLASRLEGHRIKRLAATGSTLLELLHDCRDSLCSDPKDKIYALVGLARDCRNQEVVIDYSKSLGQIYKDVMSLYSVTKFNDWDRGKLRDTVQLSSFLQDILRPPLDKQGIPPLELGLKDTELVWVAGKIVGSLFQEPNISLDKVTSTDLRKVFKFADGMMVVHRATKPTFEEFKSVPEIVLTAPIATPNFPDYPRRFTVNNGSSIINDQLRVLAPANSEKQDMVLRFSGCDKAVVLRWRKETGCVLIGTAVLRRYDLTNTDSSLFDTESGSAIFPPSIINGRQDSYMCLNFAVLQRLTAV